LHEKGIVLRKYQYLIYSVIAAFAGYGIWIFYTDGTSITAALHALGFSGVLLLCSLSLCNYFLRYVRWQYFLRKLGDKPHFLDGLYCYCAGFALTTTPGKAGEAIRCLYFKNRHRVEHAHSFAALLSDRITDLVAATLIASFAIYHFSDFRWLGWAIPFVVLSIILAILFPAPWLRLCSTFEHKSPSVLKPFFAAAPLFFQRAGTLLAIRPLLIGTLLGTVSWSAEAWGFAWLAQQVGCIEPAATLMGVFCLAMIAGAALPGGLGGTEAAMAFLLIALGLGSAEAAIVTILCRLTTLWLSILIGLCAILWLTHSKFTAPVFNTDTVP